MLYEVITLIENLGFEYTELDSGNVGKLQTKYGMSKEELKAKNDESLKDRQQSLQDVLRRINDMRK